MYKSIIRCPLFFLINSYTTGISSTVLKNILNITVEKKSQRKSRMRRNRNTNGRIEASVTMWNLRKMGEIRK